MHVPLRARSYGMCGKAPWTIVLRAESHQCEWRKLHSNQIYENIIRIQQKIRVHSHQNNLSKHKNIYIIFLTEPTHNLHTNVLCLRLCDRSRNNGVNIAHALCSFRRESSSRTLRMMNGLCTRDSTICFFLLIHNAHSLKILASTHRRLIHTKTRCVLVWTRVSSRVVVQHFDDENPTNNSDDGTRHTRDQAIERCGGCSVCNICRWLLADDWRTNGGRFHVGFSA